MALFPISIQKEKDLLERMKRAGIREKDLEESFVRSSGAGGQKVNKTATCVVLHHGPSGETVKCQKARTQGLNRFYARRILLDKIETKLSGTRSAVQQKFEKIRRQKRRRSKRAKERMLSDKKHRSEKKSMRGPVRSGNNAD